MEDTDPRLSNTLEQELIEEPSAPTQEVTRLIRDSAPHWAQGGLALALNILGLPSAIRPQCSHY